MIDISDKNLLEEYLIQRGIVQSGDGHSVHYCKGGVSGTVVYLDLPGKTPMIIKQALAQLKVKDTWLCDPNRMGVEYDSNRIFHDLMPDNAPEVYFYDDVNYIYGREAVPDGCAMWKSDLMSGLLDFEVARKSIETLVEVHNHCAGNQEMAERFASKAVFYDLRIDPYITFTVKKYPALQEAADRVSREMMENNISLVHGDYSPKNIMVVGRGISVLDYEVAHYGHPAFDLAFFTNHFMLKSIQFPELSGAFRTMLRYMTNIYMDKMAYMDKDVLEECTVRTLAFLMLARVDGKSPVEYMVGHAEKQQRVRDIAFALLDRKAETFDQVLAIAAEFDCV